MTHPASGTGGKSKFADDFYKPAPAGPAVIMDSPSHNTSAEIESLQVEFFERARRAIFTKSSYEEQFMPPRHT
jgi:hypothetical protein